MLYIKNSSILHTYKQNGLFGKSRVHRRVRDRVLLRCADVSFYAMCAQCLWCSRRGLTAITRNNFHNFEIRLEGDIFSSFGFQHTDWLVPAKLASFRVMNDPRSLSGEVFPAGARTKQALFEIGQFVDMRTARWDETKLDAVSVRTARNVSTAEGCFLQYGESVSLNRL